MLETTFKMDFAPGTNLAGGLASAAWRFLLPSLQLDSIVCLEIPGIAALQVLSRHCRRLTVMSGDAAKLEWTQQQLAPQNTCAWQFLPGDDFKRLPFAPESVDLLILSGEAGLALVAQQEALPVEIERVLKRQGTIFFETKSFRQRRTAGRVNALLQRQGLGAPRVYWVTPFRGELRTMFPLGDERMTKYLLRHVLFGQSFKKRAASRLGAWLSRAGWFSFCLPRRATLMPRSSLALAEGQAPPYLVAIAGKTGIDLQRYRCGLSARGKYNSNKTIFYFFDAASSRADIVVKMTRAPEFNARLENEYRVLALLEDKKLVARDSYPRPLFFGEHAKLAVVGQKAVHGEPFRSRTQATAQCPIAQQALDWLSALGLHDTQRNFVTGGEAAENLLRLYQRFSAVYALAPNEKEFLDGQIKLVQNSTRPFPLVFQHGDPGTWNMLVSEENKIIVIDWEAGETQGMPLWDLFYFMRSYGNWCARQQGVRDTLEAFAKNFFEPSEIGALLLQTVKKYCAGLGLEPGLASPLLLTCWMHRALKESARLTSTNLQEGHYFNLLRRCIANHQAPALQALYR